MHYDYIFYICRIEISQHLGDAIIVKGGIEMRILDRKKRMAVSLIPGLVGGYLVYGILDKARYLVNHISVHYKGAEPPLMSMWWGVG